MLGFRRFFHLCLFYYDVIRADLCYFRNNFGRKSKIRNPSLFRSFINSFWKRKVFWIQKNFICLITYDIKPPFLGYWKYILLFLYIRCRQSFHWKWIFDCKGGIWAYVSAVTSAVVVRGLKKCQTAKLEFTSNFSVFDWKAKIFSIFLSLTNKCFSDPMWGPKRLIINTTLF